MKRFFPLFLLAFVLLPLTSRGDEPSDISSYLVKQGFIAVQLTSTSSGRFQAAISVDRYDDVRVLVDTGATTTLLDMAWLAKRDYPLRDVMRPMQTLGGPQEAKSTVVDNISIGGMNTGPLVIYASDLVHANKSQKETGGFGIIDGILGMDILGEHSAIIDVKKSVLYLKTQ